VKVLFLGFAIPDQMMALVSSLDRNQPQIAAHKLQWNLVSGIEAASGLLVDLVSAVAVSDYPNCPRLLFGYTKFRHREGAHDVLMPYINIIILKHITRLLSALVLLSSWFLRNRTCRNKLVLVYGMHSPFVLATLITAQFFGGKVVVIIPDLPTYTDFGIRRGIVRRVTKPIDAYFQSKLIRKVTGLVVLTKYIAEDLAPHLPSVVMEGAISLSYTSGGADNGDSALVPRSSEKVILYAGALVKEYGVDLLLNAFALISEENYRLWVCGKGIMERQVEEAAARDSRIKYWGFLWENDLVLRMQQATVLVHPRHSGSLFVRYSFPSKLLEYMRSGRPVVSTALSGIPEEYYDYLYVLSDESPQGLASLLREVCSKPPEELDRFGRRSKEFVEREKNHIRQGQRVYEFLKTLQ